MSVEQVQEYADSAGSSLRVDREKGIIPGVKLLGRVSKNGAEYSPQAVSAAKSLYEGAKVNVDHAPPGSSAPRGYRDRLGVIRNVREDASGLYGDFHYNPKHAIAEQVAWDAEHAPEKLGFSHVAQCRSATRDGKKIYEAITKVHSVDLVADPATTNSIFEAVMDPNAPAPVVSTDPVEAVIMAIVDQIVTIAKSDADAATKGKQISALLKKQDKIKSMLADEKPEGAEPSKEMEALRTELKTVREQLEKRREQDELATRRQKVEERIAEAKLPDWAITDRFKGRCLAARDDATLTEEIREQEELAGSTRSPVRPTSRDQDRARHPDESLGGTNAAQRAGYDQGQAYVKQQLARRGAASTN